MIKFSVCLSKEIFTLKSNNFLLNFFFGSHKNIYIYKKKIKNKKREREGRNF
jgi:hypothetical protein